MAAGDDDEEPSRFHCLAIVRWMVASVVGLLTLTIIAMVVVVGLRPPEIRLSIDHGFIQSSPWYLTDVVQVPVGPDVGSLGSDGGVYGDIVGDYYYRYKAARHVTLRVLLRASNPSGRAAVNCTISSIRVVDMPPNSTEKQLAALPFDSNGADPDKQKKGSFSVPRQASHTLLEHVRIQDGNVLSYLFDQHDLTTSFTAAVEVNATFVAEHASILATATSREATAQAGARQQHKQYICWPVIISSSDDALPAGDDVPCKTRSEDGWSWTAFSPQILPPAPAPAPAAATNN